MRPSAFRPAQVVAAAGCLSAVLFALPARPGHRPGAPHYRVLLVGYTKSDSSVNGAYSPFVLEGDQDAGRMRQVLNVSYGVPLDAITVLDKPGQLHKDTVMKAMREVLLKDAQPDDVIIFYFTGHGTTYPDFNKAGHESQGLVMSDTRFVLKKDGTVEVNPTTHDGTLDSRTLLTGPELRAFVQELAAARVKNVTMIIDSCHAGGTTRGEGDVVVKSVDIPASRFDSKGGTDGSIGSRLDNTYTWLLACQTNERARAVTGSGSVFTNALVKALRTKAYSSYQDLIDQAGYFASAVVGVPVQLPVRYGDATQPVFGQTYRPTPDSFGIKKGTKGPVLNAGAALGMQEGFVVGLYPSDTVTFDKPPVAKVRIKKVGAMFSETEWMTPAITDDNVLSSMRAVIIDGIGNEATRVYVPKDLAGDLPGDFTEAVKDHVYLKLTDQASGSHLRLAKADSGGYAMLDNLGRTIDSFDKAWTTADQVTLLERLRQCAQARCVRSISPSQPGSFSLEFKLVPCESNGTYFAKSLRWDANLSPQGVHGDDYYTYAVRVVPTPGMTPPNVVYVSIISVGPNLVSKLTFPDQDFPGEFDPTTSMVPVNGEWYVMADGGLKPAKSAERVYLVRSFSDGIVNAVETVKAFATVQPENFKTLVSGAVRGGEAKSVLGEAISAFARGATRDVTAETGYSDWSVAECVLRPLDVKEPKP